jgi:hypothetical protein
MLVPTLQLFLGEAANSADAWVLRFAVYSTSGTVVILLLGAFSVAMANPTPDIFGVG